MRLGLIVTLGERDCTVPRWEDTPLPWVGYPYPGSAKPWWVGGTAGTLPEDAVREDFVVLACLGGDLGGVVCCGTGGRKSRRCVNCWRDTRLEGWPLGCCWFG